MLERALAFVSVACFIAFMGIIVWFVPDVDLIIVSVLVAGMALFDFYRELFRKNGGTDGR